MAVDQPNTIGALPVAVAYTCDVKMAYLPGLAMRKAADRYPGTYKPKSATRILSPISPEPWAHTQRAVDRNDETLAALKMLAGLDEDIANDCTGTRNRLRSVLIQIHPALELAFQRQARSQEIALELLIRYGGSTALAKSGFARVSRQAAARTRNNPQQLIDEIFDALTQQTVVVPGTAATELVLASVVGAFDPAHDRLAELVSGGPGPSAEDVVVQQ